MKITKRKNFYCDECGSNFGGVESYRFEFEYQKRHVTCVEICEHCFDEIYNIVTEMQVDRLGRAGSTTLHGLLKGYHENYKKQKNISL